MTESHQSDLVPPAHMIPGELKGPSPANPQGTCGAERTEVRGLDLDWYYYVFSVPTKDFFLCICPGREQLF